MQLLRTTDAAFWKQTFPPGVNGQSPYTKDYRNTRLASWALPYKMAGEYANPTLEQYVQCAWPVGTMSMKVGCLLLGRACDVMNSAHCRAGNRTAPDGRTRYMEAWKFAYYFKPSFHTDSVGNIRYNWAFVPDNGLSVFSKNETEVNNFYQSMSNTTHYPDFYFYRYNEHRCM